MWHLTIAVWSFRAGVKIVTIERETAGGWTWGGKVEKGQENASFIRLSVRDSSSSGFKRSDHLGIAVASPHTHLLRKLIFDPRFSVLNAQTLSLSFFFSSFCVLDCPRRKTIIRNRGVVLWFCAPFQSIRELYQFSWFAVIVPFVYEIPQGFSMSL